MVFQITIVRGLIFALALLLFALAAWVLTAQFFSPRLAYFPADRKQAEAWQAAQQPAKIAAEIGAIRGDLSTVAAITKAAPILYSSGPFDDAAAQEARDLAERAATLSPHDARAWLIFAAMQVRLGKTEASIAEALKLSYYTAPNETALMSLRLQVAVQSEALDDEELQSLVQGDVQRMFPDKKQDIIGAYQAAKPKGREVIEAGLAITAPDFLTTLSANPR